MFQGEIRIELFPRRLFSTEELTLWLQPQMNQLIVRKTTDRSRVEYEVEINLTTGRIVRVEGRPIDR